MILVPESLAEKLEALKHLVNDKLMKGNLFEREAAEKLKPFVMQVMILTKKYDCVAVRCLDTYERGLPSVGFLTVEDSETGQLVTIDTRRADGGLLGHFFKKRLSVQDTLFKKCGIDCLELSNKPAFIGDVVRFFRRRMRY